MKKRHFLRKTTKNDQKLTFKRCGKGHLWRKTCFLLLLFK